MSVFNTHAADPTMVRLAVFFTALIVVVGIACVFFVARDGASPSDQQNPCDSGAYSSSSDCQRPNMPYFVPPVIIP